MNKNLILIITILILLYVLIINYKTIKTKLSNFKSSFLVSSNPISSTPTIPPTTIPPTTSPPQNIKIPVKNIISENIISIDNPPYYISNIIDGNYNSVYANSLLSYDKNGKLPVALTFNFISIVRIKKIILHVIGNINYNATKVVAYINQKTALNNNNDYIQSFDVIKNTNSFIEKGFGADIQSVFVFSTPYMGNSITLWFHKNSIGMLTIKEIEFFE